MTISLSPKCYQGSSAVAPQGVRECEGLQHLLPLKYLQWHGCLPLGLNPHNHCCFTGQVHYVEHLSNGILPFTAESAVYNSLNSMHLQKEIVYLSCITGNSQKKGTESKHFRQWPSYELPLRISLELGWYKKLLTIHTRLKDNEGTSTSVNGYASPLASFARKWSTFSVVLLYAHTCAKTDIWHDTEWQTRTHTHTHTHAHAHTCIHTLSVLSFMHYSQTNTHSRVSPSTGVSVREKARPSNWQRQCLHCPTQNHIYFM